MSASENPAETTAGGPYLPGETGNRGGRPRGLARRVRELIGDDANLAVTAMLEIAQDETQVTRDRMAAWAWLVDRGFGKVTNTVIVDAPQGNRYPMLDLSKLSTDELKTLRQLMSAAAPDQHPVIEQSKTE